MIVIAFTDQNVIQVSSESVHASLLLRAIGVYDFVLLNEKHDKKRKLNVKFRSVTRKLGE